MPRQQPVEHSEVGDGDWGGGGAQLDEKGFEAEPPGGVARYNAQAEQYQRSIQEQRNEADYGRSFQNK